MHVKLRVAFSINFMGKFNLIYVYFFSHRVMELIAMENMKVRIAGTMKAIKDFDPSLVREWDAAIAKENAKEK